MTLAPPSDRLLSWFAQHQRALPWRTTPRDAYASWVSEVMLQQTQVATMLRYHARFLEAFPTVDALAKASEADVLRVWGYYRRARLLHAGAKHVVAHGWPTTFAAWRRVPGVGAYTAGALASLVHGERVPAVDGNVHRVLTRYKGLRVAVDTAPGRRDVTRHAMQLQPAHAPGAFNEALMELGALVCTPRAPACSGCPWRDDCVARQEGKPEAYPTKAARTKHQQVVRVAIGVTQHAGRLLMEKRTRGVLAGTWGLPWVELAEADDARTCLEAHVAHLAGAPARAHATPHASGVHVFSHRTWHWTAYAVETTGRKGDWNDPHLVGMSSVHRRVLKTSKDHAGETENENPPT